MSIKYEKLKFDQDGFWDSEQYENELPIQFWQDEVPDQKHLDVLLKAWNNEDVAYTIITGDPEEFDAVEKYVYLRQEDDYWYVWWSGNMAVQELKKVDPNKPIGHSAPLIYKI